MAENLIFIYAIPSTIHAIGFCLIYKIKHKQKFKKIQRFYLLNLCFAEFSISFLQPIILLFREYISEDVSFYLFCHIGGGLALLLFLTYLMLTLDRFLMAYLNIRYAIVMKIKVIHRIYYGIYIASVLLTLTLCLLNRRGTLMLELFLYVWTPNNTLILVISIVTYLYIGIYSRKNRSIRNSTRPADRFSIALPSLLVTSFIIFHVLPCLVVTYFIITEFKIRQLLYTISMVSYIIALTTDALLFIFSTKTVMKVICRRESRKTQSDHQNNSSSISTKTTSLH